MPSFCQVALTLALIAPAFATSSVESKSHVDAKSPVEQSAFYPHEGRLGSSPYNGHKHGNRKHKLDQRMKKLEEEVETLRQTVFDMERYFAGFSHAISLEGHKRGPHYKHHHHHHHHHKKPSHPQREIEMGEVMERDLDLDMMSSLEELD
ncbi:hypothetical protein CALVIDRAFT_539454 [Calocera viscosa TUFC12733]|uniref:BZIP domain-containing protein n=1 Tax=Calocera viscosa (strain TUFC12733) TaxID=1330018 RepID=A0A167JYN8_CALVF|nr:hypothetical protein CALVIDRAFT_539454 [Calocera viscosa TUFC12733]